MNLYEKAVAGIDEWKLNNRNKIFGPSAVMEIVNKDNPNPVGLLKAHEIFKQLEGSEK